MEKDIKDNKKEWRKGRKEGEIKEGDGRRERGKEDGGREGREEESEVGEGKERRREVEGRGRKGRR